MQGEEMSRIKNMPRIAWLVIGVLVTLLVIPSTAYAAVLSFTGIQGISKSKADVTPAHQLLTTEALPDSYFTAGVAGPNTYGATPVGCTAVTQALPAGDDAIIQHFDVGFFETAPQAVPSGQNYYGSIVQFELAPTSANFCSTLSDETYIADALAPGGNTGNVDLPMQPGFVVPNGDQVYAYAFGSVFAESQAYGYLIPTTDAPSASAQIPPSTAQGGIPLPKP
jgi:xanthosine utilization system XapX-like protein